MKEKWDFTEVEAKFIPAGDGLRAVDLMRTCLPAGAAIVEKPPSAYFDLYLDTPDLILDASGYSFRIRFGDKGFRRKAKYRTAFKSGQPAAKDLLLARREVMTDLSREEMLEWPERPLPGRGATLMYEALSAVGAERSVVPAVAITTHRRYFTMRAPGEEPDFMMLAVERSMAFDARTLDVRGLLEHGTIDWTSERDVFEFELVELELTVENHQVAEQAFSELTERLRAAFSHMTLTKYRWCLSEFGRVKRPLV